MISYAFTVPDSSFPRSEAASLVSAAREGAADDVGRRGPLAGARGTARLTVDASDSARGFFEKRGYIAQQRNTISIGDEWLANTTLQKQLAAKREAS